jgi:hypothetical protein
MAINTSKYTIGKHKCFESTLGGRYYLQNDNKSENNKDIYEQFGLTRSDLGILVEQDFSSNPGSFPYHPSQKTLLKTIDVLKYLDSCKLGELTKKCLYKRIDDSGVFFVFEVPPTNGQFELAFPEKVSNTNSKGIFNPGDMITGLTKSGKDITSFQDNKTDYFLLVKTVRTYNQHLGSYSLQIWDEHGFLECFEKDLKHWIRPAEKPLFKAGDKLIGKSKYGSDITSNADNKEVRLPYYMPDKVVYSSNMQMLDLWKDGAHWRCYEKDIRHYEGHFRPGTVPEVSNPFLVDEVGKWPMFSTPLIFRTGGEDKNPCMEVPLYVKQYPLTPSEAYKERIKPVLLSPIKIKKRPLI